MRGRILKKSLAVMLLITMLLADFLVLGMNIVSYAVELISATNHDNVNFTAYFKNTEGQKVYSLEKATNSEDIRLYMDVTVSKEGYFNGKIELGNANFAIKDVVQNNAISKVENNSIYLNQINSGESVQIEVIVEPKVEEKIDLSLLNMESSLNISGTYVYGEQKEKEIKAERKVNLVLTNPATEIDYTTKVVTNKIYEVDGTNKRVVQLLLESKLNENAYPVKNTNIEINVPTNVEKVKVISRGTLATDGKQSHEFSQDSWEYIKTENKLNISLENTAQDEKINWAQNASDKIIVTFVFAETENVANLEITSKAETELYDTKATKLSKVATVKVVEELDGVISVENSSEEEIYKGKLYTGEERTYTTNTKINFNFEKITDKIVVEENTKYEDTELNEISSNIEYKTTTINKERLFKILGEEGYLKISDINGTEISNITKETETDEQGEIIVKYNGIKEIKIETSEPAKSGIIELKHQKAIRETLERETVKNIKNIKETVSANYETETIKTEIGKSENKIELKETTSLATLEVNKEKLSTVAVNEDVEIKVTLLTNKEKYDLYKNPTLEIQLPEIIEKVKFTNVSKAYCSGLKVVKAEYKKEEGKIIIVFSGEQTNYEEYESIEGPTIILRADITLNEKLASQESQISLKYTNDKVTNINNDGVVTEKIKIEAPSGMLAFNELSNYGISTISGISEEKQIVNIKEENNNIAEYKIGLLNNSEKVATDVKILGNFPTTAKVSFGDEQIENTIKTNLKSAITVTKGTVYYSENENANRDLSDETNGWTTDVNTLNEVKVYLIQIDSMDIGELFTGTYSVEFPENIEYNKVAYTTFNVIYREKTESEVTSRGTYTRTTETGETEVQAPALGVSTGVGPVLETAITASVNGETIENNKKVYEKEVIIYTVKIENSGKGDAEGVEIKGSIPEGTTYVESDGGEVKDGYCVITTDIPAGQTVTKTYSVKVNEGIEDGKSVTNKIYINNEEKSSITHILKEEDKSITVTIENTETVEELKAGYIYKYKITVKNNTSEDLESPIVYIAPSIYFNIIDVNYENDKGEQISLGEASTIILDKLKANVAKEIEVVVIAIAQETKQSLQETYIYAEVNWNEKTYKSGKLNEKIRTLLVSANIDSDKKSQYVKAGDEIQFTITIKNEDIVKYENIQLRNVLNKQLSIIEVQKNGTAINNYTVTEDGEYNNIDMTFDLEVQESAVIKIKTKVNSTANIYSIGDKAELILNAEKREIGTVYSSILIDEDDGLKDKREGTIPVSTDPESKDENNKDDESTEEEGKKEDNNKDDGSTGEEGKQEDNEGKEDSKDDNENKEKNTTTTVSGTAWLDINENGKIDTDEEFLENINVKLFNVVDNKIQLNSENKEISTKTDKDGKYILSGIPQGEYIVIFDYDETMYSLTTYRGENISEEENSDVIAKSIKIDNKEVNVASTDILKIKSDKFENINVGLIKIKKFDLELNKYISKIVVTNSEGTKTTEYDKKTLGKVEIKSKLLNETTVVVEYTIEVKNVGEVTGYVKSIVDYLPTTLNFNSELNKDWYQSGSNIYTKSLENIKLEPGESKEIKLVLTKRMTENDTGLVNNTAELSEVYNEKGLTDINSTPANKVKDENDMGSADIIIAISTGGIITYITLVISLLCIIAVGAYFINKKVIKAEL